MTVRPMTAWLGWWCYVSRELVVCLTDPPKGVYKVLLLLYQYTDGICRQKAHQYRCTDGRSRFKGPSLSLYRWADGFPKVMGPSSLLNRWTDGLPRLEGPSLLLTDGPMGSQSWRVYRYYLTDGPMSPYFMYYVRPMVLQRF